jgi:hypothetical protein
MTGIVSPAFLLDVKCGEAVSAELWGGITDRQIEDWDKHRTPALYEALHRLTSAGVPAKELPQSKHWDWRLKAQAIKGLLAMPGFSVMCGGITQGMMIVECAAHHCELPEQKGKHLVYIEFLETSPRNRKALFDPPQYKGVGSLLIRAAIELSLEEGFKGRIGLHSLPQSNNWYTKVCGMRDLGADSNKQNLHYFEMTQEQAEAFRKGDLP